MPSSHPEVRISAQLKAEHEGKPMNMQHEPFSDGSAVPTPTEPAIREFGDRRNARFAEWAISLRNDAAGRIVTMAAKVLIAAAALWVIGYAVIASLFL